MRIRIVMGTTKGRLKGFRSRRMCSKVAILKTLGHPFSSVERTPQARNFSAHKKFRKAILKREESPVVGKPI